MFIDLFFKRERDRVLFHKTKEKKEKKLLRMIIREIIERYRTFLA